MLARIRDSYKAREKIPYYDKLRDTVKTMEEKEFHDSVSELTMFYHIISDEYRIPVVEKAHVMMDSFFDFSVKLLNTWIGFLNASRTVLSYRISK